MVLDSLRVGRGVLEELYAKFRSVVGCFVVGDI